MLLEALSGWDTKLIFGWIQSKITPQGTCIPVEEMTYNTLKFELKIKWKHDTWFKRSHKNIRYSGKTKDD